MRFQKRSYRGPRGILCTRGEKAHTSIRVSVIACDNVISKTKCATHLPEGNPFQKNHARYFIMGPNGILCTRWEKEYASVRQTFVACDDCLVKNEAYDAEKKAQTSKRVSIAAPDNAISKAQLSGTPRDTVYPWGKGANKHKSEHCRPRQCDFKSVVCAAGLALFPFFRHILFLLWRRDFA